MVKLGAHPGACTALLQTSPRSEGLCENHIQQAGRYGWLFFKEIHRILLLTFDESHHVVFEPNNEDKQAHITASDLLVLSSFQGK